MSSAATEIDFHAVAKLGDIEIGGIKKAVVDGREIALINLGGELLAIDDTCTHAYASLSEGRVEGDLVECPNHGGRFEIKTGKARNLPVIEDVRVYPVKVQEETIFVGVPHERQ